jgi:hypothetical protein
MKLAASIAAVVALTAVLAPPALATDPADALMRAGLDPDALAAAGVASGDVAGIVEDVETWLAANPTALSSADSDYEDARAEVDRLRRLVRSGMAIAQDVTELAAAKSSLATAGNDRDTATDAIFAAATADLTGGETSTLATIRGNRAWGLSIEFHAKDRSESSWVSLRDALSNEKVALAEGTSVDSACATLLAAERADADVSAAKTAFDTNVSAVTSSWQSAVSGV